MARAGFKPALLNVRCAELPTQWRQDVGRISEGVIRHEMEPVSGYAFG